MEAAGSRAQGHPEVHSEFGASLRYLRACLHKQGRVHKLRNKLVFIKASHSGTGRGRRILSSGLQREDLIYKSNKVQALQLSKTCPSATFSGSPTRSSVSGEWGPLAA